MVAGKLPIGATNSRYAYDVLLVMFAFRNHTRQDNYIASQ
jgi:hypothetical protein